MEFNKRWFLLILLPLVMLGCERVDEKLLLVNNTNKSIYYYSLLDTGDLFNRVEFEQISSHDSSHPFSGLGGGDGIWEYKINNVSPDSTLYIWVFDSSEINNRNFEGATKYRKYTKLKYKVKDLDSLKWRIEISKQDISSITK